MTITEPAPAKINLALHIRRKRGDGYHDLETLFAFARDGDVVTVSSSEQDSFAITGPFASVLNAAPVTASPPAFAGTEQNLVVQAATKFRDMFDVTQAYAITLEKNLPVASGIGGGSADAAAALRALARLTGIDLADPRLDRIARQLGADVPACLIGLTAFATGRGDDVQPLPPLGDLPLLLVNPGIPLSTAAMFGAWDRVDRGALSTEGDALERAAQGRNDFTAPAIAQAPVVADVLDLLDRAPGRTLTRLSGSGATCFGIFADERSRDSAAKQASARGWWALATYAA